MDQIPLAQGFLLSLEITGENIVKVELALNTQADFIWSIPQTDITLTMDEQTATIELKKLNPYQCWVLAKAIKTGKILSKTKPSDIIKYHNKDESDNQPAVKYEQHQPRSSEEVAVEAKNLLDQNANIARKEIATSRDIRLLQMAKVLEESGKSRKTVLKLLKERLDDLHEEVARSVNDESAPLPERMVMPPEKIQGKTVHYDVVESEEETLEVEIPDKE